MAGLIKRSKERGNRYSLVEDIIIVTKVNEGMSAASLEKYLAKCGFKRTDASLQYRIGRKLAKVESFEALHDTDAEAVKKAQLKAQEIMSKIK